MSGKLIVQDPESLELVDKKPILKHGSTIRAIPLKNLSSRKIYKSGSRI
jgi:hypothetical protein